MLPWSYLIRLAAQRLGWTPPAFWAATPRELEAALGLAGRESLPERTGAVSLRLGFGGADFGYAIDLGLPPPPVGAFGHDPEIKSEVVWAGEGATTPLDVVDAYEG